MVALYRNGSLSVRSRSRFFVGCSSIIAGLLKLMKMAGDKTVEVTPSPRIGIEDSLECLPSIMDASITHGELTQELCLILYLTYSTGGGSLYCLTLTSVAPFPNIASIGGATTQIFCQGLAAPCAEVRASQGP